MKYAIICVATQIPMTPRLICEFYRNTYAIVNLFQLSLFRLCGVEWNYSDLFFDLVPLKPIFTRVHKSWCSINSTLHNNSSKSNNFFNMVGMYTTIYMEEVCSVLGLICFNFFILK